MSLIAQLTPGARLHDRRTGREHLLDKAEIIGPVVFLSFKNLQTGAVERQPFTLAELEDRFELLAEEAAAFRADPELVSLVAEVHRIRHAYLFNPLFATETSLIDLLPHQLAAVYGVPANPIPPSGGSGGPALTSGGSGGPALVSPARPGMLDADRLRFLLADDAGAGKTIMAGLLIREMLLRRQVRRVLIVPPAGLVGNWERELRVLFRLRFRILGGGDFREDVNPFTDPANSLAIISVDTLWRDRVKAAYLAAPPYDLVAFDEAHKLSAARNSDLTLEPSHRYEAAELIARQNRHLLLMTATPHMGKDDPYYYLWRLLEPLLFSTPDALSRLGPAQKRSYLLRRMKEEMVHFDGRPLFLPRTSNTSEYPLRQEPGGEQELYDEVTAYCQTHFDRAKRLNRSAAGLAMSILQRRLASSTWAMYRSLVRREEKLNRYIGAIEAGALDESGLARQQGQLPTQDVRDQKTGDEEEAEAGQEEAERRDEESEGATDAQTLADLRLELQEVRRLVRLARTVYDQKNESKFKKLWETVEAYPDTKLLIFTEFKDTLDFLVDRLAGYGLAGKIAQIHGGMDYKEREHAVNLFREPDGARILVATDAAGEGINLQFCWLLVNYDIPWNPARLEQRMGRVHRYKQTHPVLLVNMVSENTREGRVLKVLLDKLETIRKELGSDKVFDIIGRRFTGKPLTELIFEAVVEGKEAESKREIEQVLTVDRTQAYLETQQRKVEVSEVRALLQALSGQKEAAEMRRMLPAYVRRFFQQAAGLVGLGIKGDITATFRLDPCPAYVTQALAAYPEPVRERLTFDRETARPDLGRDPPAIYLHPGEPVFEAVVDLFLGQYDDCGMRGAVFFDAAAAEPYIFYLAKTLVLRDPEPGQAAEPEIVEEKMTGLRRYPDGRCELAPAHLLLTLHPDDPSHPAGPAAVPTGLWQAAGDTAPAEAFVVQEVGFPAYETRRREEEKTLPVQRERLRVASSLRQAELMRQRRLLKEAVEKGVPAAPTRLRRCEAELRGQSGEHAASEAGLFARPGRLRPGPVTLLAQALVLPLPPEEAARRTSVETERIALAEVRRREEAEGSVIEDVSNPQRKAGFDFKVHRADGSLRYVEIKGTTGRAAVELDVNEWTQAANHPDRYWLYVVYHCDTVPELLRVPDPFSRLVAKQTGSVRINVSEIVAAAK